MSTRIDTEMGALDRIRAIMEHRKITMRTLSEDTGIPYRSVQNYLSGKHGIPLDVFKKICSRLGLSSDWVLFGEIKFNHHVLTEVLIKSMGDVLPIPKITKDGHLVLTHRRSGEEVEHSDLRRAAHTIAIIISGKYDVLTEAEYYDPSLSWQDEEDGQ